MFRADFVIAGWWGKGEVQTELCMVVFVRLVSALFSNFVHSPTLKFIIPKWAYLIPLGGE